MTKKITVSLSKKARYYLKLFSKAGKRKSLGESLSWLILFIEPDIFPFKLKNPKGGSYVRFPYKTEIISVNITLDAYSLLEIQSTALDLSKSDYIEAIIRTERDMYKRLKLCMNP